MSALNASLSRRSFLKAAVGTCALAGAGTLVVANADGSFAEAEPAVEEHPSLCNACSSKCGFMAKVKDGRLWELSGLENHPNSKGKLCARGHGFATIAYSDERVTEPLKNNGDGTFSPISWDDAMSEIGSQMKQILADYGPDSVSVIHDPRPTGKVWTKNFIHALGSNNIYTHAAACDLSRTSGILHCTGYSTYGTDMGKAKVIMFLGRSYADGIRPSQIASLAAFHKKGGKAILVDPRLSNTAKFADTWVPLRPGTDLAFLLGIANHLIANDLYDHDFIANETVGFDEWAEAIKDYTPEWAADICDIPVETITEVAETMAKAAPSAVIEHGWKAVTGCAYRNSTDTSRAVCMVNSLLGNWNQEGGAIFTSSPKAGSLDKARFPTPAAPESKRLGDTAYPLADPAVGSNLAVLEEARDGVAHAVFFYNSNALHGYANPQAWTDAMKSVDLKVAVEVQMSETATQCDYVLPECSYLERVEAPEWLGGKTWNVALRSKVIDVVHPETKPADEIFNMLAEACGVGDSFTYSAEELGRAQVESLGLSYDDLSEQGVIEVPGSTFEYGVMPEWKTPTGKFQFTSPAHEAAGLDPLVRWVEPAVTPGAGEFRIIPGKQSIHSHTMTLNNEMLNAISREYDMERVWINVDAAAELGIADGDLVEISNDVATAQVRVKATQRIRKDALFIPSHYGGASRFLTRSYGYGVANKIFHKFETEPGVGSTMENEVIVSIKKVSA